MAADGINRLLLPAEIARLGSLRLGSRFTVEGSVAGGHRSQLKGVSVEFADYRQYVPGDDPKHLDWRVYGRNERLYLRQYEEETSLRVHLLVDGSRSMAYASGSTSKYRHACTCAAALAYITIRRQDTVGLALFDRKCKLVMPPRSGAEHLRVLCNQLAEHEPVNETDLAAPLHHLAEQAKRRGLVIIFSDLFDDVERLRSALAHFRRRRHDVIVYQILDRAELDFPFRDTGAFQDLETGELVVTSPKEIRNSYQNAMEEFLFQCRKVCAGLDVEHILALTDQAPVDLVFRHLHQRALAGR
ncbi:MAG TPA: DUF58 domain-containing protein [Lentisphaeria bacterium]|nr:DUF58 domain-containing protein [Lentisphaeria bacterium]